MSPRALLVRQFFWGLFRSEAFSEAGAGGYRTWLISAVSAFIGFHMMFARVMSKKYSYLLTQSDPAVFLSAFRADELFYVSASGLIIALITALQWQSLFPGERDFHVLTPLPLRRADIFLARLAALGIFLSIFLLAFSLPPALVLPAVGSRVSSGPVFPRFFAHVIAGVGAGLQAFAGLMAVQGLCLTLIPHRWRSGVSHFIQAVVVVVALALIPVVWHIPGLNALIDARPEWMAWIPAAWWMGVCETLRGGNDPWFAMLASRAWIALALSVVTAAVTYLILYGRFSDFAAPPLQRTPKPSRLLALVRRDDSGSLAFLAWTLTRSPQHRLLLSAIAATGASLALDGFTSAYLRQWLRGRDPQSALAETSLALPLLLVFSLCAGFRLAYRIPAQWPAHWIFRIAEDAAERPSQMEASVTAQYWFAVVPALLIGLPFQWATLGWERTTAALPLLLGFSACLIEGTMRDWGHLPFTAIYAPTNRPAAMTLILFFTAFGVYGFGSAEIIRRCTMKPLMWLIVAGLLLLVWSRLRAWRRSHWGVEPLSFAADASPPVLVTGFAPE